MTTEFGKRLKLARLYANLTQVAAAKALNTTQSSISTAEREGNGSVDTPIYAKVYSVDSYWLATGKGEMLSDKGNTSQKPTHQPSVPLISYARAGRWGEINGYVPDTDRRTEARYTAPSSSAFALVVVGESMTSSDAISFPQGTVLVVDPERSPKSGDFVIAKDTAVNAGAFRKLMRDGARWYLKPLNRDYPILELEDMAKRVVGVVIEFQPPGGKL